MAAVTLDFTLFSLTDPQGSYDPVTATKLTIDTLPRNVDAYATLESIDSDFFSVNAWELKYDYIMDATIVNNSNYL